MEEKENVFTKITADIPRERFERVVDNFRTVDDEFTEYLEDDCCREEYLVSKEDIKEVKIQSNKYFELADIGGMRGLRATKMIPKSTLVLESEPIVSLLGTDSTPSYCS